MFPSLFGFRAEDILPWFAPIMLFSSFTAATALYIRYSAILQNKSDSRRAWCNYVNGFNLIYFAIPLAWVFSVIALKLVNVCARIIAEHFAQNIAIMNVSPFLVPFALFTVPPFLFHRVCVFVFRTVHSKVRGVKCAHGSLLLQVIEEQNTSLLPAVLACLGIDALIGQSWAASVFWLLSAYLCHLVNRIVWIKARSSNLTAIKTGHLHYHIVALANNIDINIKKMYCMHDNKPDTVNTFASKAKTVFVSDTILDSLDQREVDAILAQEMAHLKGHHQTRLQFTLAALIYISALALFLVSNILKSQISLILIPVLVLITVLYYHYMCRRFEYQADAVAVEMTNDPAGLMRSIIRLAQLNHMPVQGGRWSEFFSVHPTPMHRVHAIARRRNISSDRMAEILTLHDPKSHYACPVLYPEGARTNTAIGAKSIVR